MSRQRVSDRQHPSSGRSSGRGAASNGNATRPSNAQRGLAQTRRPAPVIATPDDEDDDPPEDEEDEEEENSTGGDLSVKAKKNGLASEDLNRLVKNFVRYALACEFTRTPLRRDEISKKVLEGKYSRSFTEVFEQTQNRLESVFRMRLVELPAKEKHQTIQQQRRSAQSKSGPVIKSWILTSTLSDEIRRASDHTNSEDQNEAIYQGLVAVIVSLIYLNNGILQEGIPSPLAKLIKESLNRYLRYLSIEDSTPLMTTDKLLTTMAKQGYIDKVKDMITGEPRYDYHLGPRGKVEVGKKGALDLVKKVFGDEWNRDLGKRIQRSMDEVGSSTIQGAGADEDEDETRPRKRARQDNSEDIPRGGRSRRGRETEAPLRESSRASARRRQPEPEDEEEDEEEPEDDGEVEEEEEEAPRARRRGSGNGTRGNSRGRARGRGSARGRRRS